MSHIKVRAAASLDLADRGGSAPLDLPALALLALALLLPLPTLLVLLRQMMTATDDAAHEPRLGRQIFSHASAPMVASSDS